MCRLRVAAGKAKHKRRRLINCPELSQASKHHLQSFGFFPFGLINLGFLLRKNLAAIFIIPSSWGSQLDGALHYHTVLHQALFWRPCRGGKRRLRQGEFRTYIFYFVLSFALLYFYLHHFIKNTKKLVSFIVPFIYLLLVLLE
jgi:hypothetical protein